MDRCPHVSSWNYLAYGGRQLSYWQNIECVWQFLWDILAQLCNLLCQLTQVCLYSSQCACLPMTKFTWNNAILCQRSKVHRLPTIYPYRPVLCHIIITIHFAFTLQGMIAMTLGFRGQLQVAWSMWSQRVWLENYWIVPTPWWWIMMPQLVGQAPSWVRMVKQSHEVCRWNRDSPIQ